MRTSSVYSFRPAGLLAALIVVLLGTACQSTTALTQQDPVEATPVETTQVEPTVVDVIETPATSTPTTEPSATVEPEQTPNPTPVPTVAEAATDHSGLAGTRGLTLQWVSWEPQDWGTVEFVALVDGSYAVSGTQAGPTGDFVSIEGTLVQVRDQELHFTGQVIVQVSYTNDGEPCVRDGDLTFLATGDRQFWRMQDLLNCDGIVTDYVDIYFG